MKWVTWDQSAIAAFCSMMCALVLTRLSPTPRRFFFITLCKEFAVVAALYTAWRVAMVLPLDHPSGAIARARHIDSLQHWLHFPSELSVQRLVLPHHTLAQWTNFYYAVVHVPATIAFLVWMFLRHRDVYPRWRNALAMLTAACLFIRYIRVAPPRFLPDLGYVDLATRYGLSVYGPVGTGVSDQFAAMPSIHVGWAALVSFGIVAASRSSWRWLFLGHVVITTYAVTASGNHWWLDSIAAIALLGIALVIDSAVRSRITRI